MTEKEKFLSLLQEFVGGIKDYVSTDGGEWTIKGFIDTFKNIYTLSSDTKILSKVLEIHLFPEILKFAKINDFQIVLAKHQNYYPDISFVKACDQSIRFAVDFKTTYRDPKKPHLCNGFTLGSHGEYFTNRTSTKNIQFPYSSYLGHFCLGIIYDRIDTEIDETKIYTIEELQSIDSVASNFVFFIAEKWKIASDRPGSGNTANIGSIKNIEHIISGEGMFSKLGEKWFDDYWKNYNKIIPENPKLDKKGNPKKICTLEEFVNYRKGDTSLIVEKSNK